MHWMSGDLLVLRDVDGFFVFCVVHEHRGRDRGQGHPKKDKTKQILEVISDPRVSLEHRKSIGKATEIMGKRLTKSSRKHERSQVFYGRAWHGGRVRGHRGHPKKDHFGADTKGDLRFPEYRSCIAQASAKHRSIKPKFWTMWFPEET